jgi:hypothetical protein
MVDQILAVAVVLLPTLFAVGIEVISKEIKEHPYWRIGVLSFGVGLSALTWFQMSRATKAANVDREQAIVETSEKVSAKVSESVSKSVTKAVSEQYAGTINSLQLQIGSLQGQVVAQGKNVEAIKGSDIVSGKKPIQVEVTNPGGQSLESKAEFHVATLPATPNPTYGKHARQMILTTNRVMNGGHVTITCKGKIRQATETIANAGAIMSGGVGGLLDEHTYQTAINSPNWSPNFPLVVTLYFDEDDLGICTITPLS